MDTRLQLKHIVQFIGCSSYRTTTLQSFLLQAEVLLHFSYELSCRVFLAYVRCVSCLRLAFHIFLYFVSSCLETPDTWLFHLFVSTFVLQAKGWCSQGIKVRPSESWSGAKGTRYINKWRYFDILARSICDNVRRDLTWWFLVTDPAHAFSVVHRQSSDSAPVLRKENWMQVSYRSATRQFLNNLKNRRSIGKHAFRKVSTNRLRSLTPEKRDKWLFELANVAPKLGFMDSNYNWYRDRLHRVIG